MEGDKRMDDSVINEYGTPLVHHGRAAIYESINMPPIKWLIDGLLKLKGIGSIYGSNGTMKSYTAIDLACRMVNGMDFHGHQMKQSDVVYIAGEAEDEVQERIDAWIAYHGATNRPKLIPWSINIGSKGEMQDLTESVMDFEGSVKLVVFDSLSDCSSGTALSDPDKVNESLKPALLDFVRITKASVLLVHHTGYNESHERGAKVLRDMTDTTIKVTKGNSKITWKVEKLRRAKAGKTIHFGFKDVSDLVGIENALIITSESTETVDQEAGEIIAEKGVPKRETRVDKLCNLLADNYGSMMWKDAAKELGWWNAEANKATNNYYEAIKDGRIRKEGDLLQLVL
jgi:hypothetical protein